MRTAPAQPFFFDDTSSRAAGQAAGGAQNVRGLSRSNSVSFLSVQCKYVLYAALIHEDTPLTRKLEP